MIDVINVPKGDKFQGITERAPEELNFPASYLGNHSGGVFTNDSSI
jgi:4-oxalocrotonate tautomerase